MGTDTFENSQASEAALANKVSEIQVCLGNEWETVKRVSGNWFANVRHQDGRELHFSWDSTYKPKRLNISGNYPNYADGRYFSFYSSDEIVKNNTREISVAWDREPKAIAREIERRLLPGYTALYAEAKSRIATADDWLQRKRTAIGRIATLFGDSVNDRTLERDAQPTFGHYRGVQCKVSSDTSFTVTLSSESLAEAEEAIKALTAVLKKYGKGETNGTI